MKIVTVSQMQEIEKAADAGGLTYAQMMENAGQGLDRSERGFAGRAVTNHRALMGENVVDRLPGGGARAREQPGYRGGGHQRRAQTHAHRRYARRRG